ncbi:NlpC/P60 family protein [Nocardia sp. NPDC052001]|uniref:NlpC/P60 family protein n=1 Tax=Nocardia sp. NPDC052001 TaxID=3154853 RepID=UPI00342C86CD
MTEVPEASPESESIVAERESPPGPAIPWTRRLPPVRALPPVTTAGGPGTGAPQPSGATTTTAGPPRPAAIDAQATAGAARPTPGAPAAPTGAPPPAAGQPGAVDVRPPAGADPAGAAAPRPDSARVHSDSGERDHDDRRDSDSDLSGLASAAPALASGLAMLPMLLSSLLGGGGGGSGSGGGSQQNGSGTTNSGQPVASSGGGSQSTLSPQAQSAIDALERLRATYGKSDGASTPGTKPAGTGVQPGGGTSAGNGKGAAALSAVQLYQRTAAIAFNNLDNQLAGYLAGLAGTHGIDKAALNSLIKELDLALIKIGSAAYTPAGAQKVHDILTIALREGIKLAGASQVNSSDTAAAINSLTDQYLYNIAGQNYKGTMPTASGVSAAVQKVIAVATAQIGKPYVWGAEGPNSFDCSGLMQYAARAAGVNIPRVSQDQYRQLPKVNPADIRPGDLIFPAGQYNGGSPTHVMMYIGNGQCVEAPRTGLNVRIIALPSSYAASRWS